MRISRRVALLGGSGLLVSGCQNTPVPVSAPAAASSDRPLEGERISYAKRDVSIDAAGRWVVACKLPSVRNETRYRNNDISIIDVAGNRERVLRFAGVHMAYGGTVSPDGKRLAVIVQNTRQENSLLVLDMGTFKVRDVFREPKTLFLMPVFVGDRLFYFKTEPANWMTLETRFMTCTTESNAKDEVYRLYSAQNGKTAAVSDLRFHIPQAIRTSGHRVMLENDRNGFANRHFKDSDYPISRFEVPGMGALWQFPRQRIEVLGGDGKRTYFFNGAVFSIDVGIDRYMEVFGRLTAAAYEHRYDYPQLLEEALKAQAVDDYAVNRFEYLNFVTSCADRYLFTGNVPGANQPPELIICDDKLAVVHTGPFYPDAWDVVDI